MSDLISRADAIEAVCDDCEWEHKCHEDCTHIDTLKALPSAEAEPKMTEEVREALMRLTMCAREECGMCKYKDECGFDFQYKISTDNMNTLLDALSAEAVQGWIPCSERLPKRDELVLVTYKTTDRIHLCKYIDDGSENPWWSYIDDCCAWNNVVLAWMPLPTPYKGGDE